MFDYDRSVLLCSFVEAVCCDVVCFFVSHFAALTESYSFVGLLSFAICRVLFSVLSRSVFSFFRMGSLDDSVSRYVNFGACVVRILSMSCSVCSIVVFAECRHTHILYSHVEPFILALITFFVRQSVCVCGEGGG